MKFYDIISNLKFLGIKNYKEMEINSLTCNSKEKTENGIYFCIKGLSLDGHNYAEDAIKNGAVCLVVERYLNLPITQILVENVRSTMSYISSVFYSTNKTNIKFIGITGTNGKTTTTFVIRDILRKMGKIVGLIGTEGIYIDSEKLPNDLTTPDPIMLHKTIKDMQDAGCEYCVMEVSAHAIALNKIDDINYDVVGLSNITKDHLDFFLNMENYIACKSSLFDINHAKTGVVNIDAKYCKDIAKKAKIDVLTIGNEADLKIINKNQTLKGSTFKLEHNNKTCNIRTNLMGEYNIYNITLATACLLQLGFSLKEIATSINNCEFSVPGRFNFVNVDAEFNVLIDYAHTPDGIKNILTAVKKLPVSKLITVFGCGGNRDRTKRNEMGQIALKLSDYVVVTSDNPRNENPDMIIDEIVRGIESKNMVRISDRKSAIEYALSIAKKNDIVAILGKGAEDYQEIKGEKIPFSDYQVVENYFKYRLKSELDK